MVVEQEWIGELQGLSLKNISVSIDRGGKTVYTSFGEMLFTHFGVSGPAILSGSSLCTQYLSNGEILLLHIDLKPALSEKQLDERILREFSQAPNKQFGNVLNHLYPSKLIPVIIRKSEIAPEKKVHDITKEERGRLVSVTKDFILTLTGVREFKEAIITQGGISVKEIVPSTMESRLVNGLRFAGEVLDVDAFTGGYNLQIAWSTGWMAGNTIE
jgi:predicted Rossmann fold flavoprotein